MNALSSDIGHHINLGFEHHESVEEFKELKKVVKKLRIKRKKRSGGS